MAARNGDLVKVEAGLLKALCAHVVDHLDHFHWARNVDPSWKKDLEMLNQARAVLGMKPLDERLGRRR